MPEENKFSFDNLYSRRAPEARVRASMVKRGKYDFAVAYPDPKSIPFDGLIEGLQQAIREEGEDLAIYAHPQGYRPLREFVADKLARDRDIHVSPDDIILGDGSGQPIHMLIEVLIDPGDVALTEDFVYSGTLGQLRRFGADVRGVETDDEGMLPDALEDAITRAISQGKRPKMIYTIPTYQNPMGWTMTLERRKAMVEIANRHGVPILEDDCYADLRLDGDVQPTSIHSLDETDSTMYVASFSKIIAPGMRIGYVTAPSPVLDRALVAKSGGSGQHIRVLRDSPIFDRPTRRSHRGDQRRSASEARCDARVPGREFRRPRRVEQARWRPVRLAQAARRNQPHIHTRRCPEQIRRGLSCRSQLRPGRNIRQQLRPPVLRLQHARRDPRRHSPTRGSVRERERTVTV